jgi:hypothetical protein
VTWRQLLAMGYDARFVVGRGGKYGEGHAWATFTENGRTFLVEPTAAGLGPQLPRLLTFRYQPRVSVAWDGGRLRYYEHERRTYDPTLLTVIPLFCEWLVFWARTRPKVYYGRGRYFFQLAKKVAGLANKDSSARSLKDNGGA